MMNVEDQLAEAMRRTAGTIDPPVTELVDGGIRRGRRRRLRNRASAASAVATVTAAAVTVGVVTLASGGGAVTSPPPAVHLVSAAEVLNKAAQAVEARPQPRPRPNQWLYEKTLEAGVNAEHGPRPVVGEGWRRLDGTYDADILHGRLVVSHRDRPPAEGRKDYAALATLPTDLQALRAKFYKDVDAEGSRNWNYRNRDGQAFGNAAQLLWTNPVGIPSKTQAALYRFIATIRGVKVDKNVKDGAGRPAIAVSWSDFGDQFLLDPATYQMVAQRTVINGHNAPISKTGGVNPKVRPGTVTYSLTRLTAKVVDKPGQR